MKLYVISEPVAPSALWIADILDGIVKEAMKKTLNIIAVTDGIINDTMFEQDESGMRVISLVVGYSLPWIINTLNQLRELDIEPILVSTYQYRFKRNYSYVAFNIAEAMRELVLYLCSPQCGRSKLALFGVHKDTVGDAAKIEGFYSGVSHSGLPVYKQDIYIRGKIEECADLFYSKYKEYDAVVCTNDLLAVYLTLYLKERGLNIPNDIYITGFGNWHFIDNFRPGITRMYTDLKELGCQAVRLHQYLQYNSKMKYSSAILECRLDVNESTQNKIVMENKINDYKFNSNSEYISPSYHTDPDILEVLKAEVFIRNTDRTGREIMFEIVNNQKYSAISEKLHIAETTIKYRITKMLRASEFENKTELIAFMGKYNLFL